ncbi:polymorphic toxin type 30 domain-containing protein [uncultured Gilliamella sp.]|uniref:polymorphic toxin type 30 domain-containing protein n=1 Tax=uncultured Gilliamella sp. TaxID=1193505 RepID=UPI00345C753D
MNRADGSNLITIPNNAQIRKLFSPKGYTGNYGYEYKWQNANGTLIVVRIHDIDITAPSCSNKYRN